MVSSVEHKHISISAVVQPLSGWEDLQGLPQKVIAAGLPDQKLSSLQLKLGTALCVEVAPLGRMGPCDDLAHHVPQGEELLHMDAVSHHHDLRHNGCSSVICHSWQCSNMQWRPWLGQGADAC